MKMEFLRRTETSELILFFNGWSRDASCVKHLSSICDVLEVHDYTELDAGKLFSLLAPYREINLIAWSLGVRAAAEVFDGAGVQVHTALALNGTLLPVHAGYGIAPEIFDGTIANWLDGAARERFIRRMAGSGAAGQRMPLPDRTPEDQLHELVSIRKSFSGERMPENIYTSAVVGRKDRIIPFAAQSCFWKSGLTPDIGYHELDLPHYPLDGLSSWEEVRRLADA